MTTTVTETYGIEWTCGNGVAVAAEGGEVPENPTEFKWNDEQARLVGGPEPLNAPYYMDAKVFLDTRTVTTDDESGEVTSDETVRTYPAFSLTSCLITSDLDVNWEDPDNPAKPKQRGGPVLYRHQPPAPIAASGAVRVGIDSGSETILGFVTSANELPNTQLAGNDSFYIDLETGQGYAWADGGPGAGGLQWMKTGVVKDPALISSTPMTSDQLPQDAAEGTWQVANSGVNGNVYQKVTGAWLNIGPVQGPGATVVLDPNVRKSYVSGYIYPLVFDRANFKYIPRLSGGTQSTYEGEVDITTTGWFPTEPYDVDRNIYPMDSITKFKPDDREFRTITYTVSIVTDIVSGTATVIQDVYQPTSSWGGLLDQLLQICYFTNGIYH